MWYFYEEKPIEKKWNKNLLTKRYKNVICLTSPIGMRFCLHNFGKNYQYKILTKSFFFNYSNKKSIGTIFYKATVRKKWVKLKIQTKNVAIPKIYWSKTQNQFDLISKNCTVSYRVDWTLDEICPKVEISYALIFVVYFFFFLEKKANQETSVKILNC